MRRPWLLPVAAFGVGLVLAATPATVLYLGFTRNVGTTVQQQQAGLDELRASLRAKPACLIGKRPSIPCRKAFVANALSVTPRQQRLVVRAWRLNQRVDPDRVERIVRSVGGEGSGRAPGLGARAAPPTTPEPRTRTVVQERTITVQGERGKKGERGRRGHRGKRGRSVSRREVERVVRDVIAAELQRGLGGITDGAVREWCEDFARGRPVEGIEPEQLRHICGLVPLRD